jgi:hypothetical protein
MNYHLKVALETDPREERLPVWARDKMTTLRHFAKQATEELTALKQGTKLSEFWLENWNDSQDRFYLPEHCRLMFRDAHTQLDLGKRTDQSKGRLTIYSLHGGLIVRPDASNVVTLESEKL